MHERPNPLPPLRNGFGVLDRRFAPGEKVTLVLPTKAVLTQSFEEETPVTFARRNLLKGMAISIGAALAESVRARGSAQNPLFTEAVPALVQIARVSGLQ